MLRSLKPIKLKKRAEMEPPRSDAPASAPAPASDEPRVPKWEVIRDMESADLEHFLIVWAEDLMTVFTKGIPIADSIMEDVATLFQGLDARPSLDYALIAETGIHSTMMTIGKLKDNETTYPNKAWGLILKWEDEHPQLRSARSQAIDNEVHPPSGKKN